MGLYCIQLKHGAAEKIPVAMTGLGFPVIRVEQRESGTHYFYEDPENKRERSFWTHVKDTETFWMSGLSPSARKVADGLSAAGLFVDERAA